MEGSWSKRGCGVCSPNKRTQQGHIRNDGPGVQRLQTPTDQAEFARPYDPIELALTSLSEATSITFHRERDSQGFPELKRDTTDAGRATGKARKALEEDLGRSVVSQENYLKTKIVKGKGTQEEQQPLLEE